MIYSQRPFEKEDSTASFAATVVVSVVKLPAMMILRKSTGLPRSTKKQSSGQLKKENGRKRSRGPT